MHEAGEGSVGSTLYSAISISMMVTLSSLHPGRCPVPRNTGHGSFSLVHLPTPFSVHPLLSCASAPTYSPPTLYTAYKCAHTRLIGSRASQLAQTRARTQALNEKTGAYGVFELNYDADKVRGICIDGSCSMRRSASEGARVWSDLARLIPMVRSRPALPARPDGIISSPSVLVRRIESHRRTHDSRRRGKRP